MDVSTMSMYDYVLISLALAVVGFVIHDAWVNRKK